MYTYHTKTFIPALYENIGDWLTTFYDTEKTNSEQSVEIINTTVAPRTVGHVTESDIVVTIKVFKSKY